MKKKGIILIITAAVLVLVFAGVVYYWIAKSENGFKTIEVGRGDVVGEVSETGAVKISEKINLSFKSSGRIESINVRVGDEVKAGTTIAILDSDQLKIELREAEANLAVAKADYAKLLAGSSEEEIQVSLAAVSDAETALENAKQTLKDIKASAEEDVSQAYENALDDLEDAELKTYNSLNVAKDIKLDYFTSGDQESFRVAEICNNLQIVYEQIENYLGQAQTGSNHDIEVSLSKTRTFLGDFSEGLQEIRSISESLKYKDTVSSASKTLLDNEKSYLNTAKNNIMSAQQDISAVKISNEKSINSAQASVSSAEASLNTAKYQLLLTQAGPTEESKSLYLAKINQAEAKVFLLNAKIGETILRSPLNGKITDLSKEAGEVAQSADAVVSVLPEGPFQIEVDIYEEDIVEIKEQNPVVISLPAFPDREFAGKVISINPAEKLVDGVVYYEVLVFFEQTTEGIKPGMTADITIETARKENVLRIPKGIAKKQNQKHSVRVLKDGKGEDRVIEIGLVGEDYAEIISGLSAGEKVIVE